jgi:hypothetical protein
MVKRIGDYMSEGILSSEATEEQIEKFSTKVHLVLARLLAEQRGMKNPIHTLWDKEGNVLYKGP